jgi:hypothetical protein
VDPNAEIVEAMSLAASVLTFGGSLESAGGRFRRRARASVRLAAYQSFHQAVVNAVFSQQTLRSTIPSVVGGYWTLPAHTRRLQALEESSRALLCAMSDVAIVGTPGAVELAVASAEAVGALARVRVPTRKADLHLANAEMQPAVELVGQRLAAFRLDVRRELHTNGWRRFRRSRFVLDELDGQSEAPALEAG